MNKKKQKLKKAIKKSTISAIEDQLIKALISITTELGQHDKKLNKEIKKRSGQLAKKLSKKIKLANPAVEVKIEEISPVTA
ncbi:recombinational DNA repair ATPase RecF [Pedobacter sp. UYP24]